MKIGEAIRKLRLERGASQEDVALEAGTNAGNLSRIERCQQQPSLELVEQIAAALDSTVVELYAYAEASQQETTKIKTEIRNSKEHSSSDEAMLFRRVFQLLSPENKKLAVEFVKLLSRAQKAK